MAPREFGALMARHVEGIKMQFRPTATLAAMYANAHMPAGQRVKAEDFVPGGAVEGDGPGPITRAAAEAAWVDQWSEPK